MEQKLYDAACDLPEPGLEFDSIQPAPRTAKARTPRRALRTAAILAACFALLISVGFGTYAYASEVKEYNDAVQFFHDNNLPTEGLTRGEIKAVYRDICTNSFTYSKTAEVIERSLSANHVGGYEILQENPTPEDIKKLWIYKDSHGHHWVMNQKRPEGIHYECRHEYKKDSHLVLDKSYIEKYDGDTLIWSVPLEFRIDGYSIVSDGVIVYGNNSTWSSSQVSYAWMAKIDTDGNLIWKHTVNHGFRIEYIGAVLENTDGSYAVFGCGNLEDFCFSQYTADGKETHFQKTDAGIIYGIQNAARFGDGYIVQLGIRLADEHARLFKVDRAGNITESFSYSGEDAYYFITDMIEFDGKIYLSAYSVPKPSDPNQAVGDRYEIAEILNYMRNNGILGISSEELTPLVRKNYTALLLVCEPSSGTPQEFYSVEGSLGGKLSLRDSGTLLWDVESITSTFFSPVTNSFTIGGVCTIFRYTFDAAGTLISQEKTGDTAIYRR